jgi:hypothetical protein
MGFNLTIPIGGAEMEFGNEQISLAEMRRNSRQEWGCDQ